MDKTKTHTSPPGNITKTIKSFTHLILIVLVSLALASLSACNKNGHDNDNKDQPQIITAKLKQGTTKLYYNATIAPLSETAVLSPLDASISKIFFHYGQVVKSGEPLLEINSTQIAKDYRTAVTDFLKSKQTYETSKTDLVGSEELHKAGVLSDQEFRRTLSQYHSDALSFFQSKFDLEKTLLKAEVEPGDIEQLALKDIDKINELLSRHFSNIQVKAPIAGVVLFPTKTSKSSDGAASGDLSVGDQVKENQLLMSIGDLSGFSLNLQISEINVVRVKPGLKAVITGAAFPGITLEGKVTEVATQAKPGEGQRGGLGLFDAVVKIPKVSEQAKKLIDVGMSAKVALSIPEKASIRIPINAVTQNDQGQSVVTVINKDGKQQQVEVTTGNTSLDEVVIVKGLKDGDKVVIPTAKGQSPQKRQYDGAD